MSGMWRGASDHFKSVSVTLISLLLVSVTLISLLLADDGRWETGTWADRTMRVVAVGPGIASRL